MRAMIFPRSVAPLRRSNDGKRANIARMATTARRSAIPPIDGPFRLFADSLPQLVWVSGPDGGCNFVNRCWTDYTGLSAQQAAGFGWQAVLHPDVVATVRTKWDEAVAGGETGEFEERIRRHDGVYRWFLVRFVPYRDAHGEVLSWFGTATDIDEQKRAGEAERRMSEERYRRLVETAHDGIGEIDLDGKLVYINDRMAAMLGYTREEMLGRPLFDFSFPEDHAAAREHIDQRARGLRRSFDWRWRHKNGSEVWVLASAAPLRDAAGRPVSVVGSSVTGPAAVPPSSDCAPLKSASALRWNRCSTVLPS